MNPRSFAVMALLAVPGLCLGAENERLRDVVRADQAERQQQHTPEEWTEISKRDALRRAQVHEELTAGRVQSARDFYNAALVMQHGGTLEEIRMAHALATISADLDPQNRNARWLKAASWDRMLMYQKKPQWYATQYTRDSEGKLTLYVVDETAVTDADRVELAAPTLAEARQRAEEMNRAR